MKFGGKLTGDYKETLINYAMRDLLGSDKGRYIMDALKESDPLTHSYIMIEAERRLQSMPEYKEEPLKSIEYLEELQVEMARKSIRETEGYTEKTSGEQASISIISTARISRSGKLFEPIMLTNADNRLTLEFERNTKIICTTKRAPQTIELKQIESMPSPSHAIIIGPVYELNAYAYEYSTEPSSITISPPAKISLAYTLNELPKNMSSLSINSYDVNQGG